MVSEVTHKIQRRHLASRAACTHSTTCCSRRIAASVKALRRSDGSCCRAGCTRHGAHGCDARAVCVPVARPQAPDSGCWVQWLRNWPRTQLLRR